MRWSSMRQSSMRQSLVRRAGCVLIFGLCLTVPGFAHHLEKGKTVAMPVTTSSTQARALYELGMKDYENLYLERCNDDWRLAVKEDPNLAVAWAWIAFNSGDPREAMAAREKAKALAPKATLGEQLMVDWIAKVQEGDVIGGISAMNDMLEIYPRDKHLIYLAGNWLLLVNGDEPAGKMMERALAIDKKFPPALNDLAYVEARGRQFAKAFDAMNRYVAALPGEPNPQDSYGELLRMAGDFEGSLKHYRAALAIDPDFVTSQLGLGDTYALMGNQEQARVEYDRAIRAAHNEGDRLSYRMQKAMTWVREGKFAEADQLFLKAAESAHGSEQVLREAQAYRSLSEYQSNGELAFEYLKSAEEALERDGISKSDKDEELAHILRDRVERATQSGNSALAGESLKRLEEMTAGTRDQAIQRSYHGAAGAVCMEQKNFEAAIAHLEEDRDNPRSMELLVQAYHQTQQDDKLHEVEVRLRGTNVPTLDQALVVPAARLRRPQI